MSEVSELKDRTFIDVADLVRLNREIKKLREFMASKRQGQRKSKIDHAAMSSPMNLNVATRRLSGILLELTEVAQRLEVSSLLKAPSEKSAAELNVVRETLLKMKDNLESEKKLLEEKVEKLAQELALQRDNLKTLSDEILAAVAGLREHGDRREAPEEEHVREIEKGRSLPAQIDQQEKMMNELRALRRTLFAMKEELAGKARTGIEKRRVGAKKRRQSNIGNAELQALARELEAERKILQDMQSRLLEEKERVEIERKASKKRMAETENERRTLMEQMKQLERRKSSFSSMKSDQEGRSPGLREAIRLLLEVKNEVRSERRELLDLARHLSEMKKGDERKLGALRKAKKKAGRQRRVLAGKSVLHQIVRAQSKSTSALGSSGPAKREGARQQPQQERSSDLDTRHGCQKVASARRPHKVEVLSVKLGGQEYAVETGQVRKVIRKWNIIPMPQRPRYVEGVINVLGTIVPVVNLKKRFDIPEEPTSGPSIIVLEAGNDLVGILVDSVSGTVSVPAERIHEPLQSARGVDSEYLRGVCWTGERLLFHVDTEKLFAKATPVSTSHRVSNNVLGAGLGKRRWPETIGRVSRSKKASQNDARLNTGKMKERLSSLSGRGLIKFSPRSDRGIVDPRMKMRSARSG